MSSTRQKPYFYNKSTNQSLWSAPPELSPRDIDALPGAEYLKDAQEDSGGGETSVCASHLLVKHRDSRRASSWKEVGGIALGLS
jgi:peptidyl-prolyl cis-trans isomerase NIMA-interacting 1